MKAIVKFVAPAALALAALSANAAGIVEIDYPAHQGASAAGTATGSASTEYNLAWPHSEAAPVDTSVRSAEGPTREEVMRKAAEPRRFDIGYFA